MELVKKNIHTERIKAKALLQIPLEEDINVSDSRPDVGKQVFTRGKIKVDVCVPAVFQENIWLAWKYE